MSDPSQLVAELDRKFQLKFQEQAQTIQQLKNTCEHLTAENRMIKAGTFGDNLGGSRSTSDVLARTVKWTISGIKQKIIDFPKGQSIWSPEFSAVGIDQMQLEFFPNGRESATIDGFCSVFFWCPESTQIKYQLFVGSHFRAPDEDLYDARMGHGHSNFCNMKAEIDEAKDEVTIGVEILEVKTVKNFGEGLKVYQQPISEVIWREIATVENKPINRVEWTIKKIGKRVATCPRGASLYSQLFTAGGVKNMLIEFYPNGNGNTQKDGFCALYLRCPEGTQIVVTLFVGEFKKGPIMAKFEGPAGKGLPEFCLLAEQINKGDDSIMVGVEVKNVTPGYIQPAIQADKNTVEKRVLKLES